MSKNTGTSELINYFDLGANGDVGIAGSLDINTIANATTDTDTFLVSDTGIIKYRTGAQLLSDIGAAPAVAGGYVPYTGATTNVDLGVYNLTASAIISNGSGSNSGIVHLESNAIHSLVNGYGSIASGTTNQFNLYQTTGAGVFRGAILSLNSITEFAIRTYTLPDADGTIALTSSLSGYLPLIGGTLTGALNGTSASFSGNIAIGSNPASAAAGAVIRLPFDNAIRWRNSSNTADVGFYLGGSNLFTFDSGLEVVGGGIFSLLLSGNTTNATRKFAFIQGKHYTNSEEPIAMIGIDSQVSSSTLYIGGGLTSGLNAATEISFQTAANNTTVTGTQKMVITSSGNVGIGTTSPPTHNLEIANSSGSVYQKMNADFGIGYFGMETADNSMRFVTAQATPIQFYINNTERMQINSIGTVLIGPGVADSGYGVLNTYKAPINSTYVDQIVVQGAGNYPSLRLGTYDQYDGVIATTGNDLRILAGLNVTTENHSIRFYTSFIGGTGGAQNYERMRIEYNGSVGIGASSLGTERLTIVQTNSNASALYLYTSGVPTGQSYGLTVAAGTNASDRSFAVYAQGGSEYLRVRGDGKLYSAPTYGNAVGTPRSVFIDSDGCFGGLSSIRASKTNIQSFDTNWIYDLNPIQFNYRKKDENEQFTDEFNNELFYGLIAEEAELVNKELCTYNNKVLIGIEYSKLVPVLVKAIQEQQIQIQELKNKLS